MTIRSTAGVEFLGSVMRYSEIERIGASYRLLRLGNCDFEFDAGARLYGSEDGGYLDTIKDALADVFSGVTSCAFHFVLPSSVTTSFQTVLPDSIGEQDRRRQLAFETRLMTGGASGGEIFSSDSRTPETVVDGLSGVQVTHLPEPIASRLRGVADVFEGQPVELVPRQSAVAQAAWVYARKCGEEVGSRLLVGAYADFTEYQILVDDRQVRTGRNPVHVAPDRLYYALRSMDLAGLKTAEVMSILLYGDRVDAPFVDLMQRTFGSRAEVFNPGPIVDLDENRVDPGFAIEGFVPCLGAALV